MTLGMGRHRREGTANGLTAGERWALFARSFLLQSVWNTRGMQNVGFAFVLLPLTRRLTAREEVSAFLKRHLRFFNTNPVFASYVVGSVAAAEIRGDANGAVEAKRALAGPLGMAGDSLFWGGLRPLAALLGVALAVTGRYWGRSSCWRYTTFLTWRSGSAESPSARGPVQRGRGRFWGRGYVEQ